MRIHFRSLIAGLLFFAGALPARAQPAPDPSGHWQGTVQAPGMQVPLDVDLAKDADGHFGGTLSSAAEKIKALPLINVSVDGSTVAFQARTDQPFTGVLAADGQSIAGEFLVSGNSLPFALLRKGDAVILPPPRSAAIGKELAGRWTATVVAEGMQRRLVMTLENGSDGSGAGRVVNEDEGGLVLPVTIVQHGSSVTIETVPIASTFTATLNDAATELTGTVTQGAATRQIVFRRAK